MTVSFIDVGQGDSELIQSPSGKVMLIDAGPTDAGSKVVKYLQDQGISTIDVVVATHPHEDHIGGMSAVLNGFTVKQFIDSGYPHTTSTYENMLNLIDKKTSHLKRSQTGILSLLILPYRFKFLTPKLPFQMTLIRMQSC
jgi:beta-lactamase superfamily II metal-dependent hydrolase